MCGKDKSLFLPFFVVLCIINKINILFMVFSIVCNGCVSCDFSTFFMSNPPQQVVYTRIISERLQVYWNVPTFQCKSRGVRFDELHDRYGIHQNEGDTFRGNEITILYDPGNFPAILENASSKELYFRNGGVPQEGDLRSHLDEFERQVNKLVPEQHFDGVGIIDFESWRPVYRQNFGSLTIYKNVSVQIEGKKHRFWTKRQIEAEATRRFELAARRFMQGTLETVRKLRPRARWGYYAYPYCFNLANRNVREQCAPGVAQENDKVSWIWEQSDALYPSLYMPHDLTREQQGRLVRGRAREADRLARPDAEVLPYVWYKYQDKQDTFLSKADILTTLESVYKSGSSGIILWGSSGDVNTKAKCQSLLEYVNEVLGPAVAKYTRRKTGEPR